MKRNPKYIPSLPVVEGCYATITKVSNFTMRISRVQNPTDITLMQRWAQIKVNGQKTFSAEVPLTSKALSSASQFRVWLLDNFADASWNGGERELQNLLRDLNHQVSRL